MLASGEFFGDLAIQEIFIEFNGPQLFSCVNTHQKHYLVLHIEEIDGKDSWLYSEVSQKRLKALRNGRITLRNAFTMSETKYSFIVRFSEGENSASFDIRRVPSSRLHKEWLPEPGERLNVPRNFGREQGVLIDLDPVITGNARAFVEPTPIYDIPEDALILARQWRVPVNVAAQRTGRAVFDLIFKRGTQRADISAFALGRILLTLQSLLDSLATGAEYATNDRSAREAVRLDAVAVFPGSFGIRLDTHSNDLFGDPVSIEVIDTFSALIRAAKEQDSFRDYLRLIGPRAAINFKNFARSLNKAESGVLLESAIPGVEASTVIALSSADLSKIVDLLEHEEINSSREILFAGRLVGVSLNTRFFRVEDEKISFTGRISEQCMLEIYGKKISQTYMCRILITTDINEMTGAVAEKYTLLSIRSDSEESPNTDFDEAANG